MPRCTRSLVSFASAVVALLFAAPAFAFTGKVVPRSTPGGNAPAAAALARLAGLAGEWEGSFEWIGTARRGAMNATSSGSAR